MAVRIRLTRTGRKNLPAYRIAVFDGRTRRDGPALEVLGWFNPLNREAGRGFLVRAERLQDWVSRGARMTLALRQLLLRQGVPVPVPPRTAAPKAAAPRKAEATPAPGKRPSPERLARLKRKEAKKASRKAWRGKKAAAARAAAAAPAAPAAAAKA